MEEDNQYTNYSSTNDHFLNQTVNSRWTNQVININWLLNNTYLTNQSENTNLSINNNTNYINAEYVIKANGATYNVRAVKTGTKKIQIRSGNNKQDDCIDIVYDSEYPTNLLLQGLIWKPTCRVDQAMKRGEMPNLIRAILKWTLNNFYEDCSGVTTIEFTDNSTFDCKSYNDDIVHKIPLGPYSMLVYGQTWYERNFSAIPSENIKAMVDKIKEDFAIPINRDFEELWSTAFATTTIERDYIESLYDRKLSWNEFAKLLHTDKKGCNILGINLDRIYKFATPIPINIITDKSWYILRTIIDNWNIDYNVKSGGKNKSRKNKSRKITKFKRLYKTTQKKYKTNN